VELRTASMGAAAAEAFDVDGAQESEFRAVRIIQYGRSMTGQVCEMNWFWH
jgi:hypothetical protein